MNPRLAEVERALFTYRSVALADPRQLPTLEELGEQIRAAQATWFTSPTKYSDALRVLPELIINSERAVHESERSRAACRQASEVYQLARVVLKYLGRVDLCGLVSDRAMRYAAETEDPLLIAAATWSLGHALLADDMPGGALDLAIKGSEALEPFVLWVPELGGKFEERNPSHKMLMSVLGGMSESERQHVQARVRAAMDAQVVNEGRH